MRSQVLAALLLLASPAFSAPAPGKDSDCDASVKPGQSIQQAIDKAKKGDKIVVEAGTYAEQLTITKDGIQLIGKGAILVPPKPYTKNFCTGLAVDFPVEQGGTGKEGDTGICIYGEGTVLAPYVKEHSKIQTKGDTIKNVVITGFEIYNFTGENIAVIGGKDVKITNNKLVNGGQYGFLTVGSTNTLAAKNTVTATVPAFIAMCMDDTSDTKFKENDISNYLIALCTQTSGGLQKKNNVTNCCVGPYVDPGIKGAKIIDNYIADRPAACPPFLGAGMVISGGIDTIVKGNTFQNIKNNGNGPGIYITDDADTSIKAQGNIIKNNVFKSNDFDIVLATTSPNTIKDNQCTSSSPDGLCKK